MPVAVLDVLAGELAVCRFRPDAPVPDWAQGEPVSVTRTPSGLSIVCEAGAVPAGVTAERGWRALGVRGPLDFGLIGVLASLAAPLADAGVPVFVASTYDTDYVLVPAAQLGAAVEALGAAGHQVVA